MGFYNVRAAPMVLCPELGFVPFQRHRTRFSARGENRRRWMRRGAKPIDLGERWRDAHQARRCGVRNRLDGVGAYRYGEDGHNPRVGEGKGPNLEANLGGQEREVGELHLPLSWETAREREMGRGGFTLRC